MYKYYIYELNQDKVLKESQQFDSYDKAAMNADLFISTYTGDKELTFEVEPIIIGSIAR